MIELRLYLNRQAQREICEALAAQYPRLQFRTSVSYERPCVYLPVYEVTESARQAEMKEWLTRLKAERGLEIEVWLICEGTWDPWREDTIILRF
jgi:hypothetical protein